MRVSSLNEELLHEILIALVLWILLRVGNGLVPLEDLSITGGPFLQRLMIVNILLAAFNSGNSFDLCQCRAIKAAIKYSGAMGKFVRTDVPRHKKGKHLRADGIPIVSVVHIPLI